MGKFKVIVVLLMCCSLWTDIPLAGQQTSNKEPNQIVPIDVSDIKDINYSTYLSYLKEHAKAPVEYVLDKFKYHDVVILGEPHCKKEYCEFISDLIEPLYREAGVKYFAMEILRSKNIILVNQLVAGKEYDQELALRIFRDFGWPDWGYKEYMDIIRAIWELNNKLPQESEKFKVIPLNSDWDGYDIMSGSFQKKDPFGESIEKHMVNTLVREVLEKGEKALVQVGYHHSFTRYRQPIVKKGKLVMERPPRFTNILYEKYGDRIFQICLHQEHGNYGLVSGKPILVGFVEDLMKSNGNKPVGFDIEDSPFEYLRDIKSYYFAFQEKTVFSDIAQGYIYLKPFSELSNVTWVEGFIDKSNFDRARKIAIARRRIKPEECKTPQQLDKKLKLIYESGVLH